MEILASRVFGDLLKNVIIGILIGSFDYCMEKNPCLQYNGSINGAHFLMRFTKPSD